MTLRRQLFLSLTMLFVVLLAASMTTSIYSARKHMHEQITIRTQETANTLALSLGAAISNKNTDAIPLITNGISEHGFYSAIIYRDTQGKSLIERHKPVQEYPAPKWFIHWLAMDAPITHADVMVGNMPTGSVQLTANLAYAYKDLWASFSEQLMVFALASALTYILSSFALKILLAPLQKVEEQAAAICDRHFIEQQPLPRTRELRHVVEAINRMSRKLKVIFHEQLALTESLRAQSHLDPVTGLSNRREFNARLQAIADSETGNGGCLIILQVSNFGRYNLEHGHEAGDECLRTIASQIQNLSPETPDAIISRRAGADFAIYLPRMDSECAKKLLANLIEHLAGLDLLFNHNIHAGAACCDFLRADHKLLSEADTALRQAQSRGHSDWKLFQDGDVAQIAREARQWFTSLNRILQDKNITFHYQPIFGYQEEHARAAEIFCRITMHDKLVHAGIFLPMAERFGLAEAFDRLIFNEIRTRSEAANCTTPLFINLSPHSVRSTDFINWLISYLEEHPNFSKRLIVETSEYLVRTGSEKIHELCELLHRHGAKLSLDHFGIHSAAFGYLHSLPLDFLKVDRSFIRDIHLNTDNQFYVQSLVQIAHSCDITILAEGVENAQEWECLHNLGIDGGQGYLLGRPESTIQTIRS